MSRSQKPIPIQVQSAEAANSEPTAYRALPRLGESGAEAKAAPRLQGTTMAVEDHALDLGPGAVLGRLREFVEAGQLNAARRLTEEASRRFPDHDEIQRARHILRAAEATPNPFAQPTTAAEIEWLDNPPAEARGNWVALVGSELVGMAETLAELMNQLKTKNLQRLPLVQRLAS